MARIPGLLTIVSLSACVAPILENSPADEASSDSASSGDHDRQQPRSGRREFRGGRFQTAGSGDAYACVAGKSGPGCTWTCDPGADAICGYTEYRESDGRVTGFLARRASLFRTRASEAASNFVTWVTSDPTALGLRGDLTAEDLDIALFDASHHGRFSLIRLQQRYRGLPILGPEATIVLSGRGQDIRLVNGSVATSMKTGASTRVRRRASSPRPGRATPEEEARADPARTRARPARARPWATPSPADAGAARDRMDIELGAHWCTSSHARSPQSAPTHYSHSIK